MSTQTISKYEQQAIDFLTETGTTFKTKFDSYGRHFEDDKERRDIYKVTLRNKNGSYTFKFGQSINNSTKNGKKPPTAYDVLTCLEEYGYADFEDFCANLGYDTDSRKAEKIYKSVQREAKNIQRIFNQEQREKLAEIN